MDNVKDVGTTIGGLITSAAACMKIFGYELDPAILAKINVDGIALAIVGFLLIFKVGKK
jgi:hypothetical protein